MPEMIMDWSFKIKKFFLNPGNIESGNVRITRKFEHTHIAWIVARSTAAGNVCDDHVMRSNKPGMMS